MLQMLFIQTYTHKYFKWTQTSKFMIVLGFKDGCKGKEQDCEDKE